MTTSLEVKEAAVKELERELGRPPTAQELTNKVRSDPSHPLYEFFGFDDVEGSARHTLGDAPAKE